MLTFKQYLSKIGRLETSAIELDESIVDQYLTIRQKTLDAMPLVTEFQNKKRGVLSRVGSLFTEPVIRASMPGQGVNANNKGISPKVINALKFTPHSKLGGVYYPTSKYSDTKLSYRNDSLDHKEVMGVLAHELAHSYQHQARLKNRSPISAKISKILNPTTGAIAGAMSTIPLSISDPFVQRHPIFGGVMAGVGGALGFSTGLLPSITDQFTSPKTRTPRPKKMSGNILQRAGKQLGLVKLSRSDRKKKKYNAILAKPIELRQAKLNYWENADEINSRVIGHAVQHLHNYHYELARDMHDNMKSNAKTPNVQNPVSNVIEETRKRHIQNFQIISAPLGKSEAKHATKQFERIIRHHESELPTDIHTPTGQRAYVEKHFLSQQG
jgi:predicted SprT family Zn-dependent metalloprotease